MEGIYKMHFNVGRRESPLKGIFIIDEKYVKYAVENKVEIHFGEVSGKHSNVSGWLEPEEITLATTDENFIQKFKDLKLETGFNPFHYRIIYWKDNVNYGDNFTDLTLKEVIDIKLKNISE